MKILSAIGSLFVKLWHWIKETAWVQPLLIVGAIFALIFSIPYFSKWIDSLSGNSSNSYFEHYRVSLNKKSYDEKSKADNFTDSLKENSYFDGFGTLDTEDAKKAVDERNTYGEKFFVVYVSESCADCQAFQPALELLADQWGKTYIDCFEDSDTKTACPFKLYTIFADEETDADDENEMDLVGMTSFERYLDDHQTFFESCEGRLSDPNKTPYTKNMGLSESDKYSYFGQSSIDSMKNFPVPTVLLVDYTKEAFEAGRPGVSEILFGVTGSTPYEKATLLLDMWNHFDDNPGRSITNKFSANYSK